MLKFEAFDIPPNSMQRHSMQLLSLSITDDQNLQKMNEGQLDLADLPFSTIQTRAVSQFLRCLSMSITNDQNLQNLQFRQGQFINVYQ